ncbi:MAG: nitroreductase family protein [Bacillota bacterium]
MDVIEAIKKRRSIRQYKAQEVPDDVLNSILDCARLAPSAGNRQPWTFVAVKTQEIRDQLVQAAGNQQMLGKAPVVIVVCADLEVSGARYEDRGRTLYAFQDTAAAIENMMLAAVSYGLGTCWVGSFRETEVRKILELPVNLKPVAMMPLGYPDQERGPRDLKPREEVVWVR